MMRYFLLIFTATLSLNLLSTARAQSGFDQSHSDFSEVLQKYVSAGSVDYKGLKSDPSGLKSYLAKTSAVSKEEFDTWPRENQLAFLINVYNAETLDLVQENYPVTSIKEIAKDSGGPWEQPVVELWGDKITLNALEHEIIRKNYPEPRIHFALVCAAKGCPVLINEPYVGEKLKSQLDSRTKIFLKDTQKNSIDPGKKVVKLSPLFDWFSEDFVKESGSVIAFVNPYMGGGITPEYKIEYTHYDWTLNAGS